MQTIGKRRTRITQRDIEEARQELAKTKAILPKPKVEREKAKWKRDFWYGDIYCDSNGYSSIIGDDLQGIWLGKSAEIIPYLKSRGIDGDNFGRVVTAVQEFQSEKEFPSYHLATNNNTPSRVRRKRKSHRINLKKDPLFLASLDELISTGYGIPTIQKELKARGYDFAYATLGRWVKERRDTI